MDTSRAPLRYRHFAICFGDSTAHLYRPTPKPLRHPNNSSIPTLIPLVVPHATPRFTLQRHRTLCRTCTAPHTVTTVSQLARVKVHIVEDSDWYLSTITGILAVAGHLICLRPESPLVNVFGEDGIFRYSFRHPVQIWRRR